MLNGEINEQLAVAADVGEGDFVLEIGPGTGSLTSVLINAGAYVLGIEKVCVLTLRHSFYNLVTDSFFLPQLIAF